MYALTSLDISESTILSQRNTITNFSIGSQRYEFLRSIRYFRLFSQAKKRFYKVIQTTICAIGIHDLVSFFRFYLPIAAYWFKDRKHCKFFKTFETLIHAQHLVGAAMFYGIPLVVVYVKRNAFSISKKNRECWPF